MHMNVHESREDSQAAEVQHIRTSEVEHSNVLFRERTNVEDEARSARDADELVLYELLRVGIEEPTGEDRILIVV
jgi:hypothetical protein